MGSGQEVSTKQAFLAVNGHCYARKQVSYTAFLFLGLGVFGDRARLTAFAGNLCSFKVSARLRHDEDNMTLKDAGPSATGTADAKRVRNTNIDRGGMDTNELVTARAQRQPVQSDWSNKRAAYPATSVEGAEDEGPGDEEKPPHEPAKVAWNPIPAPSGAVKETKFGLKKEKLRKKDEEQNDPLSSTFDYTKKYPKDKRYEELHDDARVWRTYNDEAAIFDTEMVGEAADSLDILLIFAGLFSAVLTTFVAQTSQSLSTDNGAVTVLLLVEFIAVERASSAGGSLSDIAPADIAPAIALTDVWVNALWFTSLALSLASALLAVLSKQWLRQYVSFIKGSARERALIRQFRYDGMEKWAVRTIIGLLPMLLHLALALFLAGLVVFLVPLQRGIAASVGIISVALFVAYIASIVVAIVRVESPYRTTFSDILSTSLRWLFTAAYPFFQDKLALRKIEIAATARAAEQALAVSVDWNPGAMQACRALLWLHNTTGSMSAKTLIMHSLGAFYDGFFDGDAEHDMFAQLSHGCGPGLDKVSGWIENFPQRTADDSEVMLRILLHSNYDEYLSIDDRDQERLKSDTQLALAYAALTRTDILHDSPDEGRDAKLTMLRALFSLEASDILCLLPLDFSSYACILESLGSASPLIWARLVGNAPWLDYLSPHKLDDWPSCEDDRPSCEDDRPSFEDDIDNVDLRAYLDMICKAGHAERHDRISVLQSPVSLLSFLLPIFDDLGWYDFYPDSDGHHHKSVNPLFKHVDNNEDNGDLMGDSPPPDEDAVWEPAVYPPEWPPLPAPTWAQAWEAADPEKKVREAEYDAAMEEGRGESGDRLEKLLETIRGEGETARDRDIEMQEV